MVVKLVTSGPEPLDMLSRVNLLPCVTAAANIHVLAENLIANYVFGGKIRNAEASGVEVYQRERKAEGIRFWRCQ